MKQFNWKYTQFTQFNETDTLLLVSGVFFGEQSTSGEIAVYSMVGKLPAIVFDHNDPRGASQDK